MVQWLGLCAFTAMAWVQSLVRELSLTVQPKTTKQKQKKTIQDFRGGAVVKNLPADARDTGSNPGPGRSHMPRSN